MQGNKKHTEGHSDSSSIGSLLDDTDREVSSLTARSFKSLCVAELEDSYNEPDLAISPGFTHQFSAKFHPGALNHAIKKSNVCNKLTARNNEPTIWASTFQQLPKCTQEEKKTAKISTLGTERRRLNLPAPGPRNNKHVSKVSSLIKTFDKTENQGPGSSLVASKQPIKNSFQKYKVNHGNDMACWGDTALLSIQKELSEFSDACRDSHYLSGKNEPQKRLNKTDQSYCGPDNYYPVLIEMSKVAKSNFSRFSKNAVKNRSVKVNEPTKKGNFLHSENSAFESWNAHHKKLTEKEEFDDEKTEKGLVYLEEAPFIKGSSTREHKLPPVKTTVARKQQKDFQIEPTPPETAFSVPLPTVYVPQDPLPVPSGTEFHAILPPPAPSRIPTNQGPPPKPAAPEAPLVPPALALPAVEPQASVSPHSVSYRTTSPSPPSQAPALLAPGPPATLAEEKALSPQLDSACPPWRRQKIAKDAAEKRQTSKETFMPNGKACSLSEKAAVPEPFLDTAPWTKQVNSPGSNSPSFNITELLTPIIPPKREADSMESELILLTPPPTESVPGREHEGSGFGDYQSRDSYKSKATRLLFNLKDVRKRVKRIYTPSPLLRALEDRNKTKESQETQEEDSNNKVAEKDEASDVTSVLSDNVQEKDNKADLTGSFVDSYLTLSSPQTTVAPLFYQTRDNMQQDDSKHEDLVKNTRGNENISSFRHQSKELDLRKSLYYPTLKPYSRDIVDTTAGQPMQNPSFQGEENKKQSDKQNENVAFKALPNQLSPAEDVPDRENQTGMLITGREIKGKRSTSSSEQSFVSTVEQPFQEELPLMPKACLEESGRNKSEMSAESKKSPKEREKAAGEDALQYYACISSDTSSAERNESKVTGNEQGSLMKEKMRKEKKEEANSVDSASDSVKDTSTSRSEEPQTPSSSSSSKPSMFMIKDNTFKSPPVIRTVKLPLIRSFSFDDTMSSSYKEMKSRFVLTARNKQCRDMLHVPELDWLSPRPRGQQNVREEAANRKIDACEPGSSSATQDPALPEDEEGFSLEKHMPEDEETCALLDQAEEKNEESICRNEEKPKLGKERHELAQPDLGLEDDQVLNNPSYPSEGKSNYFKNHLLSNRRGGSCAKKIITRETSSPVVGSVSEDYTYSPVSHEASEDTLAMEGTPVLLDNLSCSAVASPRSGSTVHSLLTCSSSEKPTISTLREAEDGTNPALLNMIVKSQADIPAEETLDSAQGNLPPDFAGMAERLELRVPGERAAGKPPAVPPKTEKALRRAKKLASRRKKIEEQQKIHLTEPTAAVGRKLSQSAQMPAFPQPMRDSPLHSALHSTLTPTGTGMRRLSGASAVSPSPSSTQRKLLQDPDSGQYFVVDLPAEVNLKTFYDPETGKYIQVSVPSSEGNLYHSPSSEIMNSPYASYPRVMPLQASSVAALKSPSQLSETPWLMQAVSGEPEELPENHQQDYRYLDPDDTQSYIDPVSYSHSQYAKEAQVHLGKDMRPSPIAEAVTPTDLDDFANEGVS
ncbi:cardiac-enriched FHL2-interacting protein [Nothoprocta perdicaria]|uniref:cardiac-enriched FHL2-interacting protein n=1 Tax=Nothoprocta perdicaria TaxID=30464 RepID=UPI000E1B9FBC|nr:cardiac-enriched FHL2-interacting protein [Nothoprocta perdicaria]